MNVLRIHARHKDIFVLVTYTTSSDPSELAEVLEDCLQEVESYEGRIDRVEIWLPGPPPEVELDLPDRFSYLDVVWRDMSELRSKPAIQLTTKAKAQVKISHRSSSEDIVEAVRQAVIQTIKPLISQLTTASEVEGRASREELERRVRELEKRVELLESMIKLLSNIQSGAAIGPQPTLQPIQLDLRPSIENPMEEREYLEEPVDEREVEEVPFDEGGGRVEVEPSADVNPDEILKEIMENPWVDILKRKGEGNEG